MDAQVRLDGELEGDGGSLSLERSAARQKAGEGRAQLMMGGV